MIQERIREAHAMGTTVRIRGAGQWLGAGRPVDAQALLETAGERGVVEYVPGDLTLTARAGTTLGEIAALTRPQGQWLPLDPWGGDAGTIGATVSTATAGPYTHALGAVRDLVLGVEAITGDGRVIHAGGRVVKNVAGFDLTRLLVGSWGTLAVITQVTVRLRAQPSRSESLAISVRADGADVGGLAARLRELPFVPLASELVNAELASRLGLGPGPVLLARIGGNERALAGQRDLICAFGGATQVADDVWDRLRLSEPAGSACWRWSALPTEFGSLWRAQERATRELPGALAHGNPARGVLRVVVPAAGPAAARAARTFDGTVIMETLTPDAWRGVPAGVADPLSLAIRRKFDPRGILNPGILRGAA